MTFLSQDVSSGTYPDLLPGNYSIFPHPPAGAAFEGWITRGDVAVNGAFDDARASVEVTGDGAIYAEFTASPNLTLVAFDDLGTSGSIVLSVARDLCCRMCRLRGRGRWDSILRERIVAPRAGRSRQLAKFGLRKCALQSRRCTHSRCDGPSPGPARRPSHCPGEQRERCHPRSARQWRSHRSECEFSRSGAVNWMRSPTARSRSSSL